MHNAGRIIVECIERQGIDTVFGVPGESYLPILDALGQSSVDYISTRHEGAAAMMAEAYGKLTNKPGICLVTRGPGSANALSGLHVAQQDSTPLILLIGQVQRDAREREAFQEMDYKQVLGSLCKWVAEVNQADRIEEFFSRAYHVATSGRPGPVALALPEDVLNETLPELTRKTVSPIKTGNSIKTVNPIKTGPPILPVLTGPHQASIETLHTQIQNAQKPFLIVGGSGWTMEGVNALQNISEQLNLAIGCAFRRQMLFDHTHPNYAGDIGIGINPSLADRVKQSDLLILLGTRMGEMASSGYSLIECPHPKQKLVHIHACAEELGRVYQPTLGINAHPDLFAKAWCSFETSVKTEQSMNTEQNTRPWAQQTQLDHAAYLKWSTPKRQDADQIGPVDMGEIMSWLNRHLKSDAILCNGAGNYATWVHRFYKFRRYATQLAPTSGSMGYGLPAALAAKTLYPDRDVIAFAGDGCFQMTCQEMATAMQYDLPVIVIVINNAMYGTIRMHQELRYPERVSGTDLVNPDFVALAAAYGAFAARVEKTEDFAEAFLRAREAGKPALIEIMLDQELLTPDRTLTEIRQAGLAS